ncbi:SpaA isopeptide-forming pilin-related protein [Subdoligranulum variabile]|uniref:SpaA isopeptide-forming pilin-related protein n=1 Tax=Subdoligranulum variabile TaxID=214851 RepID=UPI0026F36325|nr:SpaA isopeptide-forming pilin-related protein [Subdoligranulum variabile]
MPNHFMKLWKRGLALLLAGVLLFSNLSGSLAFAESTPPQETTEATAETAETADTVSLSEQAQAFVDAVKALDRDSMVAASNDWGLAHQAWMADLDNAVLESKLNEAIAVQEEACAPLYEAEDLYNQISEEERSDDRVQDAYAVWAAILAATYAAMENPVATGAGGEPDLAEITEMLYDDLPDAPTGSYIGSMGLPIATGQTRISISEWVTDLYDGMDAHINAEALHADDLVITVDREPGEEYAIVPLMVQVEYPANGSTSEILLPEDVVLLDYEGNPADADEIASITKAGYTETSASASGFYVKAKQDFSVEFVYHGPDDSELRKTLQVKLGESKAAAKAAANAGVSTYAAGPTPPFTTGKITSISFEGGTWLIWFNGIEAYCCSHGLNGQPNGCPTYNFSYVSKLEPGQYTPGNHYANQVNIWGGLGQLSLNLLEEKHSGTSASTYGLESESAETAAYRYYDDVQLWIMANYPNSLAAQTYRASAQTLAEQGTENRAATYSGENGFYTYIYNPPAGYAWQIVAIVGEEISEGGGTDIPDVPDTEYYSANWTAPAQSASGSFDLTFTVNADKQQLETGEKVDGAKITVTPSKTSGSIDGGSWQMSPAGAQTITTSGHTNDDNYQNNGGDGTVSWTVHYEVSKTSTTTLSGQEGPFSSQAEADAAAEAAKNAAISQLQAEAQSMVDAAIAAARAELATIRFSYDEVEIPYGFEEFNGSLGNHQTITVPADSSNDYVMKNDEWSLQVNLKKVDSETGEQIAGDALYEVYEWDTVTQQYIPFGGYNQYTVVRNEDGTYSVANGTDYGTEYDTSRKMYYTQRNEGKFIIVETRAPSGYYGDWTDVEHPGTAGTPLGKRGYYIEVTRANDGSVITLDNTHYSADIATSYTGGTKLLTSGGVETTVTIYKASDEPAAEIQYQDAGRVYNTDNSGTAANEDSYTMTPVTGVMQNDRSLGEISLSKVDLDAVRYVGGRDTDGDAMASGQAHADAQLDGAVYDLYAAEDIQHPDGITGTVDYSKITYADGTPIWHTTIRDNSGQWVDDYLPVLAKDHLVASAVIEDGWLTFSNLYLGKYYIVERGTGVVIPVEDGAYKLSGTYPDVDSKTKEPTGTTSQLATNSAGQYTDYVYKHQWSYIGQSKALDGTKTYDGYYESYATGYLCDEHNYYITPAYADEGWYIEKTAFEDNRQAEGEQLDTTIYSANYHLHRDNELAESQDQVMKGNVELSKHVSSTGSSDGIDLEGAGFTFYLISDLSKEEQFAQSHSGKYLIKSILDAYINPEYDESHPKYDFSGEAQAIAKTYEVNADQIAAYNATLTAAGDFKNGSGDGWVATGRPNEYQLAEIFSNDTGTIRVQGLPYGQYLVVETTPPKDVFQAEPFIVTIDPTDESNPQSAMANPKDAVQTPSGSYQKYTVLDEEIEVYLRVTKIDEETGKAVLLKDTAFQIYWMDEQGNHIYDENGNAKLVTMTDTTNPLLPKDVDTFYTDDTGMLVLPEKLPLGHYRLVEVNGPNGFYNEWAASAVYEDGHLQIDDTGNFADGSFYVDFSVTTDRVYKATGDDSEDSQDILVIDEDYQNSETLGVLKIRKTGEVLTGWQEDEGGTFDPEFSGEARPGHFVYEERPIPYAEYTITANEDIYTQDYQTDANGNRTLWYAKGDVVAVVRTGDGTSDIAVFAPGRTNSTYDFLSVIHDGTVGEVTVTLPLGSYHIEETGAPYGFVGTNQSYDVTFIWDKQTNDVVLAKTVTSNPGDGSASETKNYEIVNVKDASDAQIEAQVLKFHNERVKPQLDIYKRDIKTGALVAGAVYNLITVDDIYSATGDLLFRAGDLIATSAPTDENGRTTFTCDFPMRGEFYGMEGVRIPENTTANSGKYRIVELRPPQGYYLDAPDQEFEFVYQGAETSVIEMENTFENDATSFFVSKRKLTGDEELPGATLTIQDKDGNVVRQWVSGDTPTEIRGLKFDTVYTLVETAAPNGYELAESIRFKLVQRKDENGDLLNEADVYVCTGQDWLIFDHWTLLEDGMVVMRDAPSPDTPENPSSTPTPTPEQPVETPAPTPKPVASLPQTGDNTPLGLLIALAGAAGIVFGILLYKRRHAEETSPEDDPQYEDRT